MRRLDWDVFRTYREYGGWDLIAPYILVMECDGQTLYVKSHQPVEIGARRVFSDGGPDGAWAYESEVLAPYQKEGRVVRVISRDDYSAFNLASALPEQVIALGHFMCGAPLHGQWFGDLLLQIQALAQNTPVQTKCR